MGLQRPKVSNGDKGNSEQRRAKIHCAHIATSRTLQLSGDLGRPGFGLRLSLIRFLLSVDSCT
jgi:hypothetical protein